MKKSYIISMIAASLWSIIPAANASAYLNVNAGVGTQQFLDQNATFATTLNAGYEFNPYFALDGGYAMLVGTQYNGNQGNNVFMNVAAKGILRPARDLNLYGRIGGGLGSMNWTNSTNNNNSCNNEISAVGLIGVGLGYSITQNLELHLEDNAYIPLGIGSQSSGVVNLLLGGIQINF
ncbi:outer membrane beta-barrel protein [Aquella oligotrophica]|uniref:Outer membrane protein beta-barrel domain-containing protein n=1 Tax=Aquella oligotrophica TaxID=2067065 RepID=A0A2I7N8L3_9NEIS|nr:outer membrane beta-barrel protein [Aquella oligotrophica]AUR52786.1 hypothetical protein CUN60_10945 [Aquella oligotrophica]